MENSDYNELLQKKISKELSDFINELKEGYVNPANENQPIMYCI